MARSTCCAAAWLAEHREYAADIVGAPARPVPERIVIGKVGVALGPERATEPLVVRIAENDLLSWGRG
eukprot:scaffold87678_cov74-Phaeocystis_antarctica.AAC.1